MTEPQGVVKRIYTNEPDRKPFLEVGTRITCPNANCRNYIGRIVKQLNKGDRMTSDHFEGPGIWKGAKCACVRCGMRWYLPETTQIHTSYGWLPKFTPT